MPLILTSCKGSKTGAYIRLCQGHDRYFNTDTAYKNSKVPFLRNRRTAHTHNFMKKRKETMPDLLNRQEIKTRAHEVPLFTTSFPRCEAYKRCVGYHGSVAWNDLAPNIRRTETY